MGQTKKHLAAAALLAAAGCTSDFGSKRDTRDDPLLGIGSRPGSQPVAALPSNPPPAYAPSQPITPGTPTSNAALAAGGFQPLAGSSDLRIGNGSPTLSAPPGPAAAPPPKYQDVRPVGSPPAPVNGVSPAASPASYPAAGSAIGPRGGLEAAYASVAAVQPNWHKLTFNSQTREYLFSMSVPNKQNSSVPRTVEASAATSEQAIRAALEQLGRERD